jgi:hypothetical protein
VLMANWRFREVIWHGTICVLAFAYKGWRVILLVFWGWYLVFEAFPVGCEVGGVV